MNATPVKPYRITEASAWSGDRERLQPLIDDLTHRLRFKLSRRGISVNTDEIQVEVGEFDVTLTYYYATPTTQQNSVRRGAMILGWENGSLVKMYEQEGSPDELRECAKLRLSPYRPGLKHQDPAWACVLDLAWIEGFNKGYAGKDRPR